jgi:PASTA domain
VGNGFVAAQSPPAGSPLKAGSAHTLYLSEDAGAASRAEEVSAEPSSP